MGSSSGRVAMRSVPSPVKMGDVMSIASRVSLVLCVFGALAAQPSLAAMYKWVDEKGKTHYGDSIPPQYANRSSERLNKSGAVQTKAERTAQTAEARPSEQDIEKQKADAKRQLEQRRQDTALLATYSSEREIELARERELKRNQDTMRMATAGLAKSNSAEDKQKLEALMATGKQETDAINTKFDGYKARYRELTGVPPVAQATSGAKR